MLAVGVIVAIRAPASAESSTVSAVTLMSLDIDTSPSIPWTLPASPIVTVSRPS